MCSCDWSSDVCSSDLPIHLICVDSRTQNVYVIAGNDEGLFLRVLPVSNHPPSVTRICNFHALRIGQMRGASRQWWIGLPVGFRWLLPRFRTVNWLLSCQPIPVKRINWRMRWGWMRLHRPRPFSRNWLGRAMQLRRAAIWATPWGMKRFPGR